MKEQQKLDELDFSFEELEEGVAPSLLPSCANPGCGTPGCGQCSIVDLPDVV
jgi:hypothetical protein